MWYFILLNSGSGFEAILLFRLLKKFNQINFQLYNIYIYNSFFIGHVVRCFSHCWPQCTVLDITLLLHIDLNHLMISFSHHFEYFLNGYFWSLRYHLTTTQVFLVFYEPCDVSNPAELLLSVLHDHVLHSTPLPNYPPLDMLIPQYSQHGFTHLCHNQSLFFLLCGSPHFTCILHCKCDTIDLGYVRVRYIGLV